MPQTNSSRPSPDPLKLTRLTRIRLAFWKKNAARPDPNLSIWTPLFKMWQTGWLHIPKIFLILQEVELELIWRILTGSKIAGHNWQKKRLSWPVGWILQNLLSNLLKDFFSGSLTSSRRRRDAGNETEAEDSEKGPEEEVASRTEAVEEEEQFACIKASAGGMIFRSCVPKLASVHLNCTSAFGQNILCYCHTDGCNGSPHLGTSIFVFFASLFIPSFLVLTFQTV